MDSNWCQFYFHLVLHFQSNSFALDSPREMYMFQTSVWTIGRLATIVVNKSSRNSTFWNSDKIAFLEKTGAGKFDAPSNKILKIFDMRPISIKEHEMDIWWYGTNIFKKPSKDCSNLRNQEYLKPRSPTSLKPRNLKPRKQKPRNQ